MNDIIKLLEEIEKMSIRKYPKSNIPFDLDIWIEFVTKYEKLDLKNRQIVRELISEKANSKLTYFAKLSAEKCIETQDENFIRLGLMAHIVEGFRDWRENFLSLSYLSFSIKYLNINIDEILYSLDDVMSIKSKEYLLEYFKDYKSIELSRLFFKLIEHEDGSVELINKS